jgi:gliding motility-associated-like protein
MTKASTLRIKKTVSNSIKSLLAIIVVLVCLPAASLAQFSVGNNALNQGGGCFRLTQASVNKKGFVWNANQINLNDTFDFKFRVNLGSNNGGGDGIMFVLRDTLDGLLIGNEGASLGFDANSMDTASLGVEIDTKQNSGLGNGDIAADHVAIVSNGDNDHTSANNLAGPIQARAGNANIEDGNEHTFDIKWNPNTEILKVYIDCSLRLTYTGDIINDIFEGDPMVSWGFIGTTSGDVNLQTFCVGTPIDSVINLMPTNFDICKGDTADLDAGENGVAYLWTPSLALSAINTAQVQAFPLDTTLYTVRRIYQCDTITDSVRVRIKPPNFNISGIVTNAQCKDVCDGEVDLTVSGGTGTYSYDWDNTATTQDISSLCDGTYIVTVQDVQMTSPNYLCYKLDTFFITEPTLLTAIIINPTKTKCPMSSDCDAEANGVPNGGTQPYNWNWTSNENVQQASALCAGWNFVTITDNQGCQAIDSVDIDVPDSIVTVGFGDTTICINSVAAIVAASSGGTPSFSYIWHVDSLAGPIASIASADAVTPVVTTEYYVESYDGNGCFGDTSLVTVNVRPRLDIEFTHVDTICPYDTIDITAIGVGGDSIYSFAWSSGNFGPTISVSPDLSRFYTVTVTDFCGTPFVLDSVKVQVGGYDDIRPSIRIEDDSICSGKSIYMIASGKGGFKGPEEYIFTWQFNQSNDNVQFVRPTQTTKYIVKIEDLCLSTPGYDTVTVYVGDTVNPEIEFLPAIACKEVDVVMKIDDFDDDYTYQWVIDTFDVFNDYEYDSLIYQFSNTGCYDFDLFVTTDFGCATEVNYDCAVLIQESPTALFDYFPPNPTNIEPMVDFVNTSRGGNQFYWIIEGDSFVNDSSLRYEFYEREDPFSVGLYVSTDDGCTDSVSAFLQHREETIIHYPNSFSPNGDGKNEEFLILSEGVLLDDFNLEIYNRLGEQLFRTTRQSQGWDGRKPNGDLVSIGTYFMIMNYRDDEKVERVIHDEIHIAITGVKTGL